jgi:AcrR family transcriptional regulator
VAYEVIKRVGGRAYRYRVESFRDPQTRRVRGKWTYLGRVEGEGTLSAKRPARPNSRVRLLDALERLLEVHDIGAISTGMIAREAGVAYGTFYRYFNDLEHIVREAVLRLDAMSLDPYNPHTVAPTSFDGERHQIVRFIENAVTTTLAKPGLVRTWFIASNQDAAVVAERRARFECAVDRFTAYIERLNAAGITRVLAPRYSAYAFVALITEVVRECAVDRARCEHKMAGLIDIATELLGLAKTAVHAA